jgi:hypothetical protein
MIKNEGESGGGGGGMRLLKNKSLSSFHSKRVIFSSVSNQQTYFPSQSQFCPRWHHHYFLLIVLGKINKKKSFSVT